MLVVLNIVAVVTPAQPKSIWNHDHVVILDTGPSGLNGQAVLLLVTAVQNIATDIIHVVPQQC